MRGQPFRGAFGCTALVLGGLLSTALGCSGAGGTTPDGGALDGSVTRPDGGGLDAGFDAGVHAGMDAGCLELPLADGGCSALAFTQICAPTPLLVLHSDVVLDSAASASMGAALAAACTPAPQLLTLNSQDGGLLDADGAPLVERTQTILVAGGSFTQPYVAWLERSGGSLVRDTTSGTTASISTRAGDVIFTEPLANLGPSLDYFVLEFIRADPFGPLSIIAYGFFGPGTTAASWYFEHRVLPARSTSTAQWYVVRWNDLDGDGKPSEADAFVVLRAGP
jgi:hypothetical protein